jgi:DNA polymerase-1
VVEKPRFQPTKTGLNQVLNYLDPEAPKLQAVSQKAVSDFDMALTDYLGKKAKAPGDADTEQFCTLLYKARKALKPSARNGAEYGMLEMFCQEVLEEHAPGKTVISGDALNFNADQQMQALLYGKLGLPVRKRSKVEHGSTRDQHGLPGAPATGLKAIAAAFVYDILDEADWRKEALLAYRQAVLEEQKQSLYFTPYPLWKHPRDGKIHPSFRNCGTVTRRPVGSSPNGLQVAKGPLRALFLGGSYVGDEEPRVVVSADVAGQEAVVTAVESGDAKMLEIFSAVPRKDFHSMTSSGFAHVLLQRAGLPVPGKLTYEQFVEGLHSEDREIIENYKTIRNKYGKGVGFTLLYGGGYRTLAGNLLIDEHLAKEIFFEALNLYSGLEPWQRRTAEFARQHGYVQSVYGTRRHAEPNLWSEESGLKARAERQMCNFLAQGTSADMLKVAKQGIWSRGMRDKYRMRAAGFIYDEVRSSVPVSKAVDYMEELNEVMSITPPTYPIGMQIEFSVGWDWFAQEEIGLFDREKAKETVRGLLEKAP